MAPPSTNFAVRREQRCRFNGLTINCGSHQVSESVRQRTYPGQLGASTGGTPTSSLALAGHPWALRWRPCLQMEQVCQSAPRYAALRIADCPRDHAAANRADDVGKPRGQESVHGAAFISRGAVDSRQGLRRDGTVATTTTVAWCDTERKTTQASGMIVAVHHLGQRS